MSKRLVLLLALTLASCSSADDRTVEVGFVQDMLDHHEQAVRMSLAVLAKDDVSPITRAFAGDVVASQRYEMGLMQGYLDAHDERRGSPGRDVMTWMDMTTPFADMPGLAPQAELDALAAASGDDADDRFFRLMIEHHRGGIHMAEYAVDHADDDDVHALAERIAKTQTLEIGEMEQARRQLGLD